MAKKCFEAFEKTKNLHQAVFSLTHNNKLTEVPEVHLKNKQKTKNRCFGKDVQFTIST